VSSVKISDLPQTEEGIVLALQLETDSGVPKQQIMD
jgi:hypothetical protein